MVRWSATTSGPPESPEQMPCPPSPMPMPVVLTYLPPTPEAFSAEV
jgi:hypothetical protein